MRMGWFKVSTLVCLCLVFCQSHAASLELKDLLKIFQNKDCSEINFEQDLSLEKLQGVWYMSYQVNPLLATEPPCQTLTFKVTSPNSINFNLTSRILKGVVMRGGGNGEVLKNEAAVMNWQWDFAPGMTEQTIVAATNYENYAVLISCNVFGNSASGFLLSRSENISPSHLTKGKQILATYMDISGGKLMKTDTCDLDPLSSQEKILAFGSLNMEQLFKEIFSK